jgi:hypothetical protein
MSRFGVMQIISEEVIAQMGEDVAAGMARANTDRRAAMHTGLAPEVVARTRTEKQHDQHMPWSDPETGELLPPGRPYAFTYELPPA